MIFLCAKGAKRMSNNNRQNRLARVIPDLAVFRKAASRMKIRITMKNALPDDYVKKGETGDIESALNYCRINWPDSFKKLNQQIKQAFNDIPVFSERTKRSKDSIKDIQFCYFAYGFTPTEYFAFRLDEKKPSERRTFISSRLRMVYRCKMNDILKADLFNDKAKTYQLFKSYYKRNAVVIEKNADYEKFIKFTRMHPTFVKKAVFEAQGNSVELIDKGEYSGKEKEFFSSLIKTGKHILEEKIKQSPEMAAFNASSVNTVRVVTFNTRKGIVVPYCTIRTGRPGSFVDNGGAGGIQASIDYDSGIIKTDGYDEIGGVFENHPSTGIKIKGYRLPEWEQLKKLCVELAEKITFIKFIGWDFAHTKDGWIMVEGNENCYIIAKQMIENRGLKDTFNKIMINMDLNA